MSFVDPIVAYPQPDIRSTLLEYYKGRKWNQLPTPALLVSESVVDSNITKMLKRVNKMGTKFRGHVKTHKTIEVTKKQLGYNLPNYHDQKFDSIVVSTLLEVNSILKYQAETGDVFVKDVIYGIPNITDYTLEQSLEISKQVEKFTFIIDSLDHISIIQKFNNLKEIDHKWSVIVKLDNGTNRAGILNTDYLIEVIHKIFETKDVELYGFYVHSGHSYNAKTIKEAEANLLEELETVKNGLDELYKIKPEFDQSSLIVSIGATPTLHSLEHHLFEATNEKISSISNSIRAKVELHAGNYTFCDLQQVSTGCINESNIALSLSSTVISQYPGRKNEVGEILINSGVIALSKEIASSYPGFGLIKTDEKYGVWKVDRLSQEHGILQSVSKDAQLIPIGTNVRILPNHACITANSFNAYYVLNDEGEVINVWIPWRGW